MNTARMLEKFWAETRSKEIAKRKSKYKLPKQITKRSFY